MLGDHLDVPEHGHEVRVAAPARDDVEVAVIRDPGPGDPADVPAEVEALGAVDGAQGCKPLGPERVDLERLVVLQVVEVQAVAVRSDQQMPGCVRELVQQHEGERAAMNDELLGVVGALRGAAEDAAVLLVRVLHVFEAPRRPEPLHYSQRLYRKKPSPPATMTTMVTMVARKPPKLSKPGNSTFIPKKPVMNVRGSMTTLKMVRT